MSVIWQDRKDRHFLLFHSFLRSRLLKHWIMCLSLSRISSLVALGFNDGLTPLLQLRSYHDGLWGTCVLAFSHQYYHNFSFQSHWLLSSNAFAEVRGENMPERKIASNGDQTHNHQVMSLTLTTEPPWQGFPKQVLVFTRLQFKSFENTVGKGEIASNKQFILFPQRFLPVWVTFCQFHEIWNCRLQTLSVWKSLKLCCLVKG